MLIYCSGAQGGALFQDKIYVALKKRNNGVGKPEFRVLLMVPGAFLVPVGLFLYGWSSQAHLHWIVPNIGTAIFCAGTIMSFQCMQSTSPISHVMFSADLFPFFVNCSIYCGFIHKICG